jgi:hypothetical protein
MRSLPTAEYGQRGGANSGQTARRRPGAQCEPPYRRPGARCTPLPRGGLRRAEVGVRPSVGSMPSASAMRESSDSTPGANCSPVAGSPPMPKPGRLSSAMSKAGTTRCACTRPWLSLPMAFGKENTRALNGARNDPSHKTPMWEHHNLAVDGSECCGSLVANNDGNQHDHPSAAGIPLRRRICAGAIYDADALNRAGFTTYQGDGGLDA